MPPGSFQYAVKSSFVDPKSSFMLFQYATQSCFNESLLPEDAHPLKPRTIIKAINASVFMLASLLDSNSSGSKTPFEQGKMYTVSQIRQRDQNKFRYEQLGGFTKSMKLLHHRIYDYALKVSNNAAALRPGVPRGGSNGWFEIVHRFLFGTTSFFFRPL